MEFSLLLEKAIDFHGHFCVGLVLGTRMAIAGLRKLGFTDQSNTRYLVVYVEMDRCLADAIQATTGCTIGKRRMKFVDYGKFAATFVNTKTNKAIRISVKEEARESAMKYGEKQSVKDSMGSVDHKSEKKIMAEAYSKMCESDLLVIKDVYVNIPKYDLPGKPERKVACDVCGELVFDGREKIVNKQMLCKPCIEGAYYRII